jgi:hypothetical protein
MADVKISALPASTVPLTGTEVLPIVQGTTTKKVAVSDLTAGRAVSASSLLLAQTYDQGAGVLQTTGNSNFNGVVVDKTLTLQNGNNLFQYSQTFTNAYWALTNTTTATTAVTTAPDGTSTANTITTTASTGNHIVGPSFTFVAAPYTFSIYFKYSTNQWAFLRIYDGTNQFGASFDLVGNVVGSVTAGATSSITSVGSWYRCSITATTAAGSGNILIALNNANSTSIISYAAAGTEQVYVWGAQLELGAASSAPTVTTTAAVTAVNNISLPSGSLIQSKPTATVGPAPTIASSATIAPIANITFVSGTTTINTITAPVPLSTSGGQLTLIPTGLFLTSVTGNIALASTAVVGKALIMTYDSTTAKWYPSY